MLPEALIALFSVIIGYFLPGFLVSFLFFRHDELSGAERIAVSMAFSIALIGVLMTYLGMTVGFSAWSTLLVLLLVSVLAYLARKDEVGEFFTRHSYSPGLPDLTTLEALVFIVVALQFIFAFYYSAFFPIDGGDAVTFHAPLAQLYAQEGRLAQAEGVLELYNPLPHGFHLFISWFYLLNGFNDLFARIASPLFFLGSCLFVYSIAHRLFDRKVAALTLLIFANTPLLLAHSQIVYLNLPELFFMLAGLFPLLLALRGASLNEPRNDSLYVAAGALGGFAALVKPSGMISFGLLAVLLTLYFKRRQSLVPLLGLAAGALLSGSVIWLAANSAYYLDPTSTFYIFNPYAPYSFPSYLAYFFLDGMVAVNQGIGPFFISFGLVGLVLMYFGRESRGRHWAAQFSLAWLALIFVLSELFLLKLGARFAMLALPVTALFAAYAYDHFSQSRRKFIAVLAVMLLLLELAPSLAIGAVGFKSARISYETNTLQFRLFLAPPSNDEFMRFAYGPVVDGFNYMNSKTPAGSKVLANVPLTYYIDRTLYSASQITQFGSLEGALAYLHAHGVDYVFLADTDSASPGQPADNAIETNINNSAIFSQVYNNSRTRIYAINYSACSGCEYG
ncbi:Dolichyl-phosphate-mannose-protein mannosyltransferase [Candidatus Burarchaeum australiense]|nr:Dolichyl-phosphate-mannose-protein mannosyltransferase [Candidatus Burarchaeum australiense]